MLSMCLTGLVCVFALLASASMLGGIDEQIGGLKNPANPIIVIIAVIGFGGLFITLFCLMLLPQPRAKEKDELDISF